MGKVLMIATFQRQEMWEMPDSDGERVNQRNAANPFGR